MVKEKASITIPDNAELTPAKVQESTNQRFDKIDNLLIAVVASVILTGMVLIISVIGIFIDQLRYNNAAYTEYANKVQNVNDLQKANKTLLQQIYNQQTSILLEQKIIEKLNNK